MISIKGIVWGLRGLLSRGTKVVRLLLARSDVNIDEPDNFGQTPLWWASYNGHEGAVRLLLARGDVNSNEPGRLGQSPLWPASSNGHEGVVRLLLAQGGGQSRQARQVGSNTTLLGF